MKTAKFTRRIENFECEHCNAKITGNGYTNHCPECLWSKHVDINPGDRSCDCNGLMEPIGIRKKSGNLAIIHRCRRCNQIKANKFNDLDNREQVLNLPTIDASQIKSNKR